MCEFCRICGKDIKINPCASTTDLSDAQIIKNVNDEKAGIAIFKQCKAVGYFYINYCPMCGRKLNVEESTEQKKEVFRICRNCKDCSLDPASCGRSIETTSYFEASNNIRTFIPGWECKV